MLIVTVGAVSVAHAATFTWSGAHGTAFSQANNWVGNAAPGPTDTAVIGGPACVISTPVTIGAINLSASTLTQSAGQTLTVTGAFTQTGGAFTGGDSGISIGSLVQSNGTFTSTSGVLEVTGAFNQTGGTFTQASGRVLLDSTSNQAFTTTSATFYNLAINDGLVGYWKLDEGTGTSVADSSGFNHTGTLFNTPTWAGSAGAASLDFTNSNAMVLNGSTQYAQVTRTAALEPAAFTIALWAKRNGNQVQYTQLVTKRYTSSPPWISYDLHLNHPGNDSSMVTWELSAPTQIIVASATGALPNGVWTHITGVYDPAGSAPQQRLYINGVLSASGTSTTAVVYDTTASGDLYVGQAGRNLQYFNGTLDDIRIYKRALTDAEIYSLYMGNQPGTSKATQTLAGSPIILNDLILASGTLSVGSNNMTVGGSWDNYGGIFTAGTGTVTLNGGGSVVIRSAGQQFNNLTLNGSGATWTLEDWLKVNSSLTMTAGALSAGSYAVHASDLNKTSGTLTAGTGTVVIDTTTARTQSTGFSFNNLRIETPNESNLVGYWKLDEGQGTTIRDASGTGNDGTLNGNTDWVTTSLPSLSFDNHASGNFNGTTAYARVSRSTTLEPTSVSISAWVKRNGNQTQYGKIIDKTYGNAVGTPYSTYELHVNDSGADSSVVSFQTGTTGPTVDTVNSATGALPDGTWTHVAGVYDPGGSAPQFRLYVNGVLTSKTRTTALIYDTTSTGDLYLGQTGGNNQYFNGQVDDVRIYNVALTAAQVQSLAAGRYAGTGSGATVTLGANLTVNRTLAIDNGTLATSSYTVSAAATDSTKMSYVNAGTLQVGSSSATFNGGLTVEPQGAVTENTAGGAIDLGTGETLGYYLSGSIQGFPTAAFNWNTFAFWREYVAYNSYVSGSTTADTVLALTADGGTKYTWTLPSGDGSLLGTPRWNMEGTNHYIYLITTTGYVFKVQDTGAALNTVAGWPYHNGALATATSPLANDSSNLYWSGNDGSGNPKIFSLTLGEVLNGTPLTVASTVSAAPVLATIGGTNYIFFAIASHVYQSTLNLSSQFTSTQPTTAVNGRISTYNGVIYFPEDNGKIWALTASNGAGPATTWSYQDTNTTRHPGGCSAGNQCSVKNIYRDVAYSRSCFGDKDGHVYVLNNGVPLAGFPFQPGSSADNFQVAPVSQSGVLLIGAANGNLYEIDENNGTGPALTRTYALSAAVSSISFSPTANGGNGAYTVGTSDGKLYYVVAGSDPTPLTP